jgi:phage-related protein
MIMPTPIVSGSSRIQVRDSRNVEVVLPRAWTISPFNRPRLVTSVKLIGGDGEFQTKRDSFEPMSFNLSGYVYGDDANELRARVNTVLQHVPYGPWRVYPDGFSGRYVRAHVTSTNEEGMGKLEHARLTLGMTAFEPFFYAPASVDAPAINEVSGVTGQLQTVENSGSYLVRPFIIFTGRAGTSPRPRVDNLTTDQFIELDYTLGNGEVAIIDCERGRASIGGANALNALNAEFYYDPLELQPGNNNLQIGVDGGGDVRIDIEFTPRFL